MNTIQLECFVAVAEHLNFSRASEELKITQPAVSHQIQSLEEELGVKLFVRTSKSVTLTQEGFLFLPDAQLILKTALSARERLGTHEHFVSFDVGCHNQLELSLLPPALKAMSEDFPLLRPSVHLVPFPSIMGMIENRQIQAAFGIKGVKKRGRRKSSSLAFKELCPAPIACVCSPEHPLAKYESLTKSDLTGSIIVCSPRQIADEIFALQNEILVRLLPAERYFTENIETALTLVRAQMGYTLYPDVIPARQPDLRYIPITDIPPLSFGIWYRPDNDSPVLKKFLGAFR
ncbi:LysR family transcriptional regulator [Ruminococcus sp. CLA-AA-H200]|uniref:LysR family transcriptional regulator n=1 Tax=Ruminococcus turbiniformis TaxID=2881258 RepID=A0ABS8FV03_9FIRM|nr:LysR family transcriptional regulator [Ruminococcus turbiniformis]MCC2253878.1 LysR family transcriptional regulator [Ruminococcus turbiniformis]